MCPAGVDGRAAWEALIVHHFLPTGGRYRHPSGVQTHRPPSGAYIYPVVRYPKMTCNLAFRMGKVQVVLFRLDHLPPFFVDATINFSGLAGYHAVGCMITGVKYGFVVDVRLGTNPLYPSLIIVVF